jgi:hypothetical protein
MLQLKHSHTSQTHTQTTAGELLMSLRSLPQQQGRLHQGLLAWGAINTLYQIIQFTLSSALSPPHAIQPCSVFQAMHRSLTPPGMAIFLLQCTIVQ